MQIHKGQKKWDRNQMNKIRNEKGEVATNTSKIHRIISDYYEQLYVNKMYNLEEADTFLERNNLPDLNQEDRKHDQTNDKC